jgi:thioester reductase-like protein
MQVLNLDRVGVYDDFFDIGGHSLLIAKLLLMVSKELNKNISLHDFLIKPTIEHLARLISGNEEDYFIEGQATQPMPLQDLEYGLEYINKIDRLQKSFTKVNVEGILLTGVTGFVGRQVLYNLCIHSIGSIKIYCLIRGKTQEQAAMRLQTILADNMFRHFSQDKISNIIPICGDLTRPFLGLQRPSFEDLAKKVTTIYHIGAYVNHLYNYEQLRAANVLSIIGLIKFAAKYQNKKINYISTLSAITEKNNDGLVKENFIKKNSSVLNIADGYSQTKCVAEILLGYTKNIGISVDIFRSGWLVWDITTDIETIKNNHLYSLINTCIQLGYAPNWKTKLNLMPVRFIGEFVVRSGLEKTTGHRVFNLVNPNTIAWNNMLDSLLQQGNSIRYITPTKWHKKCLFLLGKQNSSFPFLPLYLDMEKSIRLKAPDLGNKIQHGFADKQIAKLHMEYPMISPFSGKHILGFFELPIYLQQYSSIAKEHINPHMLEAS